MPNLLLSSFSILAIYTLKKVNINHHKISIKTPNQDDI